MRRNKSYLILNIKFSIFLSLIIFPFSLYSQVTLEGPEVVLGGGSSSYYLNYDYSCQGYDGCYAYATGWDITGGTIVSSNPYDCEVVWTTSGTHELAMSYRFEYSMYGYWYSETGTRTITVQTAYSYEKETLSSYTIDTSTNVSADPY